jgi:hypothetical protein
LLVAERQRQQRRGRLGALGGKIAGVDRGKLPADAVGRVVAQEMDALGDRVVGDDPFAEQRRIILQPARRRVARQPPEQRDGVPFVQLRTVLAMASSSPLTKPRSFLS